MPKRNHNTRSRRLLSLLALVLAAILPLATAAADVNGPVLLYASSTDRSVTAEGISPYPALDQDMLAVYCIDAGAMDAFLIYSMGDAVLLDAGGGSAAEDMVSLMQALGVDCLKAAINTHPHSDHISGFDDVLAQIPAEAFYTAFEAGETKQHDRIMRALEKLGIPVLNIDDGDMMTIGASTLTCYRVPDGRNLNERSLVTRLTFGDRSILFAADIENDSVKKLAELHGDALASDVLKVPHHGQVGMAPEFLDAVNPSLAIVTNGRGNRSAAAVRLMTKRNVPCLYTILGTVEMRTDGELWYVRQFPNKSKLTLELISSTEPRGE